MLVSVITVNLNNKEGLDNTLRSVMSQETELYEHIVIDGGSSDGSIEIISKYGDYLTYWVSESDSGIYNAMNKGIAEAKGEYLLFFE